MSAAPHIGRPWKERELGAGLRRQVGNKQQWKHWHPVGVPNGGRCHDDGGRHHQDGHGKCAPAACGHHQRLYRDERHSDHLEHINREQPAPLLVCGRGQVGQMQHREMKLVAKNDENHEAPETFQ
jgi:hypothetical protein